MPFPVLHRPQHANGDNYTAAKASAQALTAPAGDGRGGAWHLQRSRCRPPIAPAAEAMKAPTNIEKNR